MPRSSQSKATTKRIIEPYLNAVFASVERLSHCSEQLFEGTPYSVDSWPELWFYEVMLLKSHISEESYATLLEGPLNMVEGCTFPPRFAERLEIFEQAFTAEAPRFLASIEALRSELSKCRHQKAFKGSDVTALIAPYVICRPRQDPFPGYKYGGGPDAKTGKRGSHVNQNGHPSRRLVHMTTELVLAIALLTQLPRSQIFTALCPYKWVLHWIEEWDSLHGIVLWYYFTLHGHTRIEAIFDDLLSLLICYEIFVTRQCIRTGSEKFAVLSVALARMALKHQRFCQQVEVHTGTDEEEALLNFVLGLLYPSKSKPGQRLQKMLRTALTSGATWTSLGGMPMKPVVPETRGCVYPRAIPITQ